MCLCAVNNGLWTDEGKRVGSGGYFRGQTEPHTMRIHTSLLALGAIALLGTSCVPKKKYMAIQASNETLNQKLADCNNALDACRGERAVQDARIAELENKNQHLKDQVGELNNTNAQLLNSVNTMATLSRQEAANLERSLEQIREQDLRIRTLHDALSKKDSIRAESDTGQHYSLKYVATLLDLLMWQPLLSNCLILHL